MILTPVQVDLVQGSDDWVRWREDGLGSSDIAAVLGLSPWISLDVLWAEKLELVEKRPTTDAMQRGIDLEPDARFLFEWQHEKFYPPACFTTLEYPFLKASLDGWNKPEIWENKAPGKTQHAKYVKKGPPEYYVCQMQFQMAVSGGTVNFFTTYNPDFPDADQFREFAVQRDDAYIEKILTRVMAFWHCLERGIEPTVGLLEQSVSGVFATF